ncbi:MAG: translation initiation factor IF-2 [Enterobacteriaceae bacterium]
MNLKRFPIISIMGHVDHGKTSLINCIKSKSKIDVEEGGITQRTFAYYIKTSYGNFTFLDTPGHADFLLIRKRSIRIADIIILVIAADDGIMPQTIEIIEYSNKFKIPLIIAINKIDKIKSNINKIKNELFNYNIISDKLGGETQFVYISAKFNKGIDKLLESIFIQSEIMELKYNETGLTHGIVIESYLDKKKGPVILVILKEGFVKKGDFIVCDSEYGRVRRINSMLGNILDIAKPFIPVEILGMSGIPKSGCRLVMVNNIKKAKNMILKNIKKIEINKDIITKNNYKCTKELNLILKSNLQSSLEVIKNSLQKLSNEKIFLNIIKHEVGHVNENDILLSKTSNSVLIGFNTKISSDIKKIILLEKLIYVEDNIIYSLIKKIKNIIKKFCSVDNKFLSIAKILNVFKISKKYTILGCFIKSGLFKKNNKIKIISNNLEISTSKIISIKKFKENVEEINANSECGFCIKGCNNVKLGDIIQKVD